MSMWALQPKEVPFLPHLTGEASRSSRGRLDPKLARFLRDYSLSLSSGLKYRESTTDTLRLFELIVEPSVAGSTTGFERTDPYEVSGTDKGSPSKKRLISWGEAIRKEIDTYELLRREIEEGFEAEANYWQFLNEGD